MVERQDAAPPPADPGPVVTSGMARMRSHSLRALAIPAGIVTLVNIFSWHGEFWAAWPLLFIAAAAAFIWITGQSGPVRRYGPPVILSAMLIGINILSGGDPLWAQWPVLAIAIVTAIRWAATRSTAGCWRRPAARSSSGRTSAAPIGRSC